MEFFRLNNGILMPAMGLGTFPLKGEILIDTIIKAIKVGFNSFDTSAAFGNEAYIPLARMDKKLIENETLVFLSKNITKL